MLKLLIILLICFNGYLTKTIILTFRELSNSYNLVVDLGISKQKYFELDLKTPYNWAIQRYYDKRNSKSYGFETVFFRDFGDITMEKLSDHLIIKEGGINIEIFNFYYSDKFLSFDSISFAHSFKNINHSLVHTLYNNKQIDQLGFGFSSSNVVIFGEMYLGEMKVNSGYTMKGRCNAINDTIEWSCKLNEVIINNIKYNEILSNYFQTNEKKILVPKSFMKILQEIYFDQYLKSGDCSLDLRLGYHTYICKRHTLNFFPKLIFHFDNLILPFEPRDLVYNYERTVVFLIEENKNDEWVFGISFFKKYAPYISYENNSVSFYTLSTKQEIFKQNIKKVMVIVISINQGIMIIILLLEKRKCQKELIEII